MSDINYGTGHNMFWGGGNEEGYDGDVCHSCVCFWWGVMHIHKKLDAWRVRCNLFWGGGRGRVRW